MNQMETVLLSIILNPALEESLIDWLLGRNDVSGFSSFPINGHGSHAGKMNMSEQVAGRQQQIMVQVQTSRIIADSMIQDLKRDYGGTDFHYWLVPVLDADHLGMD